MDEFKVSGRQYLLAGLIGSWWQD